MYPSSTDLDLQVAVEVEGERPVLGSAVEAAREGDAIDDLEPVGRRVDRDLQVVVDLGVGLLGRVGGEGGEQQEDDDGAG